MRLFRKKELKSLETVNRENREEHIAERIRKARYNGIACPECGHELADSNYMIVDEDCGEIYCPNCDFNGIRVLSPKEVRSRS